MEWLRSSNNSNNDHHFVSLMRDKCSVVEWDDWWVRLCVCLCVCVSDREKESGPRGWCEDLVDKMRADRKSQPSREPFAPQDLYMCLRPSVSLSCAVLCLSVCLRLFSVYFCLGSLLLSSFVFFSSFLRSSAWHLWCRHHIFAMLSFKFCHFFSTALNTNCFDLHKHKSARPKSVFWSKSWSNFLGNWNEQVVCACQTVFISNHVESILLLLQPPLQKATKKILRVN